MSRKQQLQRRAERYGRRYADKGLTALSPQWRAQDGFEAGYRAALKDARKAVSEDIDYKMTISGESKVALFPKIRKFLGPIR
jgi:hypothetical protein